MSPLPTTTIINASAGSGKTYRLAVAYLQALLQPLPDGSPTPPQSVLATTFTRASASEILERVLHRLADAALSDEESRKLLSEINRPDLHRADLVRLLESVCQVLPQLQVGTIDGLFSRIVRVMALDLAFPSSWTMAGDSLAAELALEAADQMLSADDVQLSRAQWRRYAQFKPGLRVRSALVKLLEENRFTLIDADIAADNPDLAEPLTLTVQESESIVRALETFDLPMTKGKPPKPNANWHKAIENIKALVSGEPTLTSVFRGHSLMRLVNVEGASYYKIPLPPELHAMLGPVVNSARNDMRRLYEARLPALAALGRRYHELRRAVAHARGAYRFAEVEAAARILPPHLFEEDLYFRLDGKIQHLLLDEFQDTSLSQFRFLWPIINDVISNGRLFFAVGDPKQSIYGWRGADRRLLERLPEWLGQSNPKPVAENRRSCEAVLRALDLIFRNLDQAACLDPASHAEKDQLQNEARKGAAENFIASYETHFAVGENKSLAGCVRLLLTTKPDASDPPDDEETTDEIGMILDAVDEHRREDPDREIAILCRRHKLMPAILAGLRTRGIAASGEGGNPVTDSAAVEAVLSMLTWLDHPGHKLAQEHAKRSGVAEAFGFQESISDLSLLAKINGFILRRGLASVISDWVRHAVFRALGTIHDQVRVEQLVELARHWDTAGGGRLSHFVEQVRSQRVDNPAASRVRVMTIHGAKGLEFEAVIVADLEVRGGGKEGPCLVVSLTTPAAPPTVTLLPGKDDAQILGLEKEYQTYQRNKFEEDLSVLYVALTRAKSFLDVVLPAEEKAKPSLSGIIRERWGHREQGVHVIDDCPAMVSTQSPVFVAPMERDPGIWQRADGLNVTPFSSVPRRLEALTPSGQEGGGRITLGQLLKTGNAAALERGTAVHALLSRIEWIGKLPSEKEWVRIIPSDEANTEACRIAARELHPRLSNPKDKLTQIFHSSAWTDRWKSQAVTKLEVWRERRFAAIIGHDLMNGSFDRVVLGRDAAGKLLRADILDFKTDRLANEAEREARALHYQPQLDAYVTALHKLTGLPLDAIHAGLVWIN